MDTPLTPLDLARRARRLYPDREAVVDGELRLTYRQFLDRCDRWSWTLQRLGVGRGDRVVTIAPNVHTQLEAFYSVPQVGAVLVPVDPRLAARHLAYVVGHSGARVVCAHPAHLDSVDRIRTELPEVEHFVALDGAREGWLDYEELVAAGRPEFERPPISEQDLVTINYGGGGTAGPRGVMVTHRSAYLNAVGALVHLPLRIDQRYLWTLPMVHAGAWAFVWAVTAVGATHVCLPRVDPAAVFEAVRRERVAWLGATPAVMTGLAAAAAGLRGEVPSGVRVIAAGGAPDAKAIELMEEELGWEVTQVYGPAETAPLIAVCEARPEHAGLPPAARAAVRARQGVELITSGELRVIDWRGREVPADGESLGEVVVRGNAVMKGYYNDPEATERVMGDGWLHTGDAAVRHPDGYVEIRDRVSILRLARPAPGPDLRFAAHEAR